MKENTRVEDFIISKEDGKKFFGDRLIITKKEYLEYLEWKKLENEKVV